MPRKAGETELKQPLYVRLSPFHRETIRKLAQEYYLTDSTVYRAMIKVAIKHIHEVRQILKEEV